MMVGIKKFGIKLAGLFRLKRMQNEKMVLLKNAMLSGGIKRVK